MADTLAEIIQLQRAEEQANSTRIRWEFRTGEKRLQYGAKLCVVGVRLPPNVLDRLRASGNPGVVARQIILRWYSSVR